MDALKCDSGPFAFYDAAVFGFTRTFFRFYHTSCPRTLKISGPSQILLWILLWQHLFNPCEKRGSFLCVCVCVSFLCVVVFIWKYLCLPVAHNMCLCFTIHLGSSRASCVCMMGDGVQPAWCLPSALYLPPSVLLPSILTSLLVGFPNWHVYGCQEQVGWGTWLLPPCLPSFRCFCPQCLPPRPGKV